MKMPLDDCLWTLLMSSLAQVMTYLTLVPGNDLVSSGKTTSPEAMLTQN